jgi:hypothetical protein
MAEFLPGLLRNKDKAIAQTFNASFRYIDEAIFQHHQRT